ARTGTGGAYGLSTRGFGGCFAALARFFASAARRVCVWRWILKPSSRALGPLCAGFFKRLTIPAAALIGRRVPWPLISLGEMSAFVAPACRAAFSVSISACDQVVVITAPRRDAGRPI